MWDKVPFGKDSMCEGVLSLDQGLKQALVGAGLHQFVRKIVRLHRKGKPQPSYVRSGTTSGTACDLAEFQYLHHKCSTHIYLGEHLDHCLGMDLVVQTCSRLFRNQY